MASVSIKGISKAYSAGVPVLQNFELEIAPGELFFLLGPSGCGKSTLLRILAGLVEPDSGTIAFDGKDISDLPAEKRRAAMVFQNYALWPHMTVAENVAFGLRTAGVSRRETDRIVRETLEVVRLSDFAGRKVPALSGGQQQRVALARALAVDPALLLLDEPLSNLDARLRDTMRNEIGRLCRERHLTALYVTHDRQEALSMADRIAVMRDGIICQMGTPEEVYNFPVNRFTAEFLGDINIIESTVTAPGTVTNALGEFNTASTLPAGSRVYAAIRPERISILPEDADDGIPATLTGRVFLGECCEWHFNAAGCSLTVRESAPESRAAGSKWRLKFHPGHLLVLAD